jgi:hypothetical protein
LHAFLLNFTGHFRNVPRLALEGLVDSLQQVVEDQHPTVAELGWFFQLVEDAGLTSESTAQIGDLLCEYFGPRTLGLINQADAKHLKDNPKSPQALTPDGRMALLRLVWLLGDAPGTFFITMVLIYCSSLAPSNDPKGKKPVEEGHFPQSSSAGKVDTVLEAIASTRWRYLTGAVRSAILELPQFHVTVQNPGEARTFLYKHRLMPSTSAGGRGTAITVESGLLIRQLTDAFAAVSAMVVDIGPLKGSTQYIYDLFVFGAYGI